MRDYQRTDLPDMLFARGNVIRRLEQIYNIHGLETFVFLSGTFSVIAVNDFAMKSVGYTRSEFDSMRIPDIFPSIDTDELERMTGELVAVPDSRVEFSAPLRRKDGESVDAKGTMHCIDTTDRTLFAIVATTEPFSATRGSEFRLSPKVFDNIRDGLVVTDSKRHVLFVNRSFCEMTGYGSEELLGKECEFLENELNDSNAVRLMWSTIERDGYYQAQIWGKRKDGSSYALEISATGVVDDDKGITEYVVSMTDVTERKQWQERIHYLAYYDPLTDLPNRTFFNERISAALRRAHVTGEQFALLFINLDRFKNVNKTFGQLTGDNLLRQIADRFKEMFSSKELVCHFGGDEFLALVEQVTDAEQVRVVAETTLAYLAKPYVLNDYEIYLGGRIGISMYPENGQNVEMLLRNAEAALQETRRSGEHRYAFYSSTLNTLGIERMKLEHGLRTAVRRDELSLVYQPQIDLSNDLPCAAEALLRWTNPRRGTVPPSEFIPIAEETGLILPIGQWALRKACEEFAAMRGTLNEDRFSLAVNLSAMQFAQRDLVHNVEAILRETRYRPEHLELEITESAIMQDVDVAIATLRKLKNMGIQIAVDDFGTGYSSLNYLRRLPIDRLKIDRSFVTEIVENKSDAAIVDAIVSLAHGLGMHVVAEGVETEAQLEYLRERGCDVVQGYVFSKPLTGSTFVEYVSAANDAQNRSAAG